jgi:hypothetical protein
MITITRVLAASLLTMTIAGCSDTKQSSPSGLTSSSELRPNAAEGGGWSYRAPNADFTKYRRFLIEPVVVYAGADNSFGDMPAADRAAMASIVGEEITKAIAEKYPLATAPGPDVLRFRPTLLGVETTIGGVATITRVLPIGIAVNAVKGASGEAGSFTGSIDVAVEAIDSQTNTLLAAAVRRATPAVYDIGATTSTSATVGSSAHEIGVKLREAIDRNRPPKS